MPWTLHLIISLILTLLLSAADLRFCSNDLRTRKDAKQCFTEQANKDPCIYMECDWNTGSFCRTFDYDSEIACFVHYCQKECSSNDKSCVINCLSLDKCSIGSSALVTSARSIFGTSRRAYRRPAYYPPSHQSDSPGDFIGCVRSKKHPILAFVVTLIATVFVFSFIGFYFWCVYYCITSCSDPPRKRHVQPHLRPISENRTKRQGSYGGTFHAQHLAADGD